MIRKSSAVWYGTALKGNGALTTGTGTLNNTPYSFNSRFADGSGTNPEELIAAAHAGCFTMALSFTLNNAGYTADEIHTNATLKMDNLPEKSWTITGVHLDVEAKIPGINQAEFNKIAHDAKANCPVSRVLNAEISMNATLT